MQIKTRPSNVRTIKQNDPKFRIIDGMVSVPRAGFEIANDCPKEYKQVIAMCVDLGWLKLVAANLIRAEFGRVSNDDKGEAE